MTVVSAIPPILATDRECLEAYARTADAGSLRPFTGRYVALIYSSAYRRTGRADQAAEVTRAVLLVAARGARRLRKQKVLASWLFHVTAVACRQLTGKPGRARWWRFGKQPPGEDPPGETMWDRVARKLDAAMDRLPKAQRDAVLLRAMLGWDLERVSRLLRTNERQAVARAGEGLRGIASSLRQDGLPTDPQWLAMICPVEGCATPMPKELVDEVLVAMGANPNQRPARGLARHTLNSLAWFRWRRRLTIASAVCIPLLAAVAGVALGVHLLSDRSWFLSRFLVWSARNEAKRSPGLAQPARPWPPDQTAPRRSAAGIRTARDLYQTTNIWLAHLSFSPDQWSALQPKRIEALPNFIQRDGSALLRNPKAQRSGLAGVLGFDFNWTSAGFEFGEAAFTNVAARVKGNGTYLASLYGEKRSFKVDLNKFTKGQKLGEAEELNFNNLVNDHSCLSDALAFEYFRDAGVPAPRTAYACLSLSVDGKWNRKPLGLYVMVEPVDQRFAAERFGSKKTPLFKPVTYELFQDLGDDWTDYEAIYDLKTSATPEQQRRVIEFARLLTRAGDAEFAARLGDFLDLDKFARFLAGQVLLSNYDGFLSDGQNFYLYLDPVSNRFGFIPWDMDLSWGSFFLLGTLRERETASIWHPWVGQHRLLERVLGVDAFRQLYRAQLEDQLQRLFVPARLNRRIDELAAILHDPIAAESDFRLGRFQQAVSDQPRPPRTDERGRSPNRPPHQLRSFIAARARSVRAQLDGKSEGVILQRRARR